MLRYNRRRTLLVVALMTALATGLSVLPLAHTQEARRMSTWKPQFNAKGELKLPSNYHEWTFLGSPLTPHALNNGQAAFPEYHNVYVHPEALKAYRSTGSWPEGTIMLKELQLTRPATNPDGSSVEVSGRGFFPAARNGIDISVKDSKRFAATKGWGFFNFGHHAPPYAAQAAEQPKAACAGCHMSNADDMVFTKFYAPILSAKP